MFNLIIDEFPTTVYIDQIEYSINFDTLTMMKIAILIEDNSHISDEEKKDLALTQLKLFYPVMPSNLTEAMKKLIDFYTYPLDEYGKSNNVSKNKSLEKISYSFKYDSNLIYSAFVQQYNISNFKKLHWFVFRTLLENLTEDCLFVKVMQYRNIKLTKEMANSEKQFYRKMKRIYNIPDNRPMEEKDKDFANVLFNL